MDFNMRWIISLTLITASALASFPLAAETVDWSALLGRWNYIEHPRFPSSYFEQRTTNTTDTDAFSLPVGNHKSTVCETVEFFENGMANTFTDVQYSWTHRDEPKSDQNVAVYFRSSSSWKIVDGSLFTVLKHRHSRVWWLSRAEKGVPLGAIALAPVKKSIEENLSFMSLEGTVGKQKIISLNHQRMVTEYIDGDGETRLREFNRTKYMANEC